MTSEVIDAVPGAADHPRKGDEMTDTMTRPSFLRRALVVDAVASGASGVLMVAGAEPLAGVLGLPAPLLRWAGAALFPFAAFVASLAWSGAVPRGGVRAVIALNVAWVAASVLLVLDGPGALTRAGIAFVLVQAAAVAVFAEVQYVGLRRATV
jgi:hypothetical protein